MKILLTTLNAKYIHSSLALRDLQAYCRDDYPGIIIQEYTINDPSEKIVAGLVKQQPDLLCFSCYIWNIEQILNVVDTVKKILPNCIILLGGPEVSYDGEAVMNENPLIDFIAEGEGEKTFKELLDCITQDCEPINVKGLIWRKEGGLIHNGCRPPITLDEIPFAYEKGFHGMNNKIIYYETSRGCPFNCQYCLSSTTGHVRFLSLERVKRELAYFVHSGVRQVKLVDRTFNCNPCRAKEIFRFLIELGGKTNFHFEMAGDLIDEEMLSILSLAPVGMFQFEIGIQSAKQETLKEIKRKTNLKQIEYAVSRLIQLDNIHIHLDLIAGLPKEDLSSMAGSLNKVLALSPHRLQLGFLKLLKGSGLRKEADKYHYQYTSYPPYEVLSNHVLSFTELTGLKQIEELVELYYNSHRFDRSMEYLARQTEGDFFLIFKQMADYWETNDYFRYSHSNLSLYEYLLNFAKTLSFVDHQLFGELLLFDYQLHEKPSRYPAGLEPIQDKGLITRCHEFLRKEQNLVKLLPEWKGYSPGQILRRAHIGVFRYRLDLRGTACYQEGRTVILFHYLNRQGVLRRPGIIPLDV
ncbi:MAG: B12-binding domain-containing radical SAM protein [Caldicoprobacterales bacterium]|nr:B12-binding domain-containing radical SAM protein [Clostridiales bacterium]